VEDAERHEVVDIFVVQMGTRRSCIQSLLDGRGIDFTPFLSLLASVACIRAHAVIQGDITLCKILECERKTGEEIIALTVSGRTRSTLALMVPRLAARKPR
jgi:hypothetical protein